MRQTPFVQHITESAPADARRLMTATEKKLGYLPAAIGLLAESPQMLDGFLQLSAMFEATSLDPLAREVLIMTIATRNECHLCVAMHTAKLTGLGADDTLITALRDQLSITDPRLAAIQQFTLDVLDTAGSVGNESLQRFLAADYTKQQALEVVLGIGTYTMSTLANRLTDAPLDPQLTAFAWDEPTHT